MSSSGSPNNMRMTKPPSWYGSGNKWSPHKWEHWSAKVCQGTVSA
jgi:hypothetical protein